MNPHRTLLALWVLVTTGSLAPRSFACEDPVLHRQHLEQEMRAALRAQGQGSPDQSSPPPRAQDSRSALDDESSFFRSIGKPTSPQR